MQLVATTPLALAIFVGILVLGPWRGLWLFFAALPFGSSAALNLSGFGSVMLTDIGILALWMSLIGRRIGISSLVGTLRLGQPGFYALLVLIISLFSAIFLPRLFSGHTDVFVLIRRDGGAEITLTPLRAVGSNIGQFVRLAMALSAFLVLATIFRLRPRPDMVILAMIVATVAHFSLTFIDIASYAVGLPGLLDGIRTAKQVMLDNQMLLGLKRVSGGFPEPSSFSYYTIGLFGFWLRYWIASSSPKWSGIIVLVLAAMILRSTSSAAYVSFTLFLTLFTIIHLPRIFQRSRMFLLYFGVLISLPMLVGSIYVMLEMWPDLYAFLDKVMLSKSQSHSGVERLAWNIQALTNFFETYGLGAGIGSVRASSWLVACLASFGVLGTVVFVWFVGAVLTMRPSERQATNASALVAAACQSGCGAILLQSLITKPYPNLEFAWFAMAGIAVGLLRTLQTENVEREGRRLMLASTSKRASA